MRLLVFVLIGIWLFVGASMLALYSYGRFARRAKGPNSCALPVTEAGTALDRTIGAITAQQSDKSGISLISDNIQAFAARALSARNAGRSLDLMYYYWNDDLTGKLLFHEVLAAADRGVRVRILLDDMNTFGRDAIYRAIDNHPCIEMRLFNPARSRDKFWRRAIELVLRAMTATRRMHNKAWIVDGRLALVGGRNIGDAYFDASNVANFRDMDLMLLGPAVKQVEDIFDSFWNSDAVLPVRALSLRNFHLSRQRKRLNKLMHSEGAAPYLQRVVEMHDTSGMLTHKMTFHWTSAAEVVSDPPSKVAGGGDDTWLRCKIFPPLYAATSSIHIISPYFIPGTPGVERLTARAKAGVDVQISTNSLAATDVVPVHGAYGRYRKPLLLGGVKLYELRRQIGRSDQRSLFGSSNASLHTKAYVVDGKYGFVGSFNFDPRSVSLNTEMGVLFEHAPLAAEVDAIFARQIDLQESYRLFLEGGSIAWEDDKNNAERIWRREPDAGLLRRWLASFIRLLPIESQL